MRIFPNCFSCQSAFCWSKIYLMYWRKRNIFPTILYSFSKKKIPFLNCSREKTDISVTLMRKDPLCISGKSANERSGGGVKEALTRGSIALAARMTMKLNSLSELRDANEANLTIVSKFDEQQHVWLPWRFSDSQSNNFSPTRRAYSITFDSVCMHPQDRTASSAGRR